MSKDLRKRKELLEKHKSRQNLLDILIKERDRTNKLIANASQTERHEVYVPKYNPPDDDLTKEFYRPIKHQIQSASCGDSHTIILTRNGEVFVCGRNSKGQLGCGDRRDEIIPRKSVTLENIDIGSICAGGWHSLVLTKSGIVYAFGDGTRGQLGFGKSSYEQLVPRPVDIFKKSVKQIAAGSFHSAFLTDDLSLYVCGCNKFGQLGLGDSRPRFQPTELIMEGVYVKPTRICLGSKHTIICTETGDIWSCGRNKHGQLGLGDRKDRNIPCLITALENKFVIEMTAGRGHTMIRTEKGLLYCWGDNRDGQLGLVPESESAVFKELRTTQSNIVKNKKKNKRKHSDSDDSDSDDDDDGDKSIPNKRSVGGRSLRSAQAKNRKKLIKAIQTTPFLLKHPLLEDLEVVQISAGARHTSILVSTGRLFSAGAAGKGRLGRGVEASTDELVFAGDRSRNMTVDMRKPPVRAMMRDGEDEAMMTEMKERYMKAASEGRTEERRFLKYRKTNAMTSRTEFSANGTTFRTLKNGPGTGTSRMLTNRMTQRALGTDETLPTPTGTGALSTRRGLLGQAARSVLTTQRTDTDQSVLTKYIPPHKPEITNIQSKSWKRVNRQRVIPSRVKHSIRANQRRRNGRDLSDSDSDEGEKVPMELAEVQGMANRCVEFEAKQESFPSKEDRDELFGEYVESMSVIGTSNNIGSRPGTSQTASSQFRPKTGESRLSRITRLSRLASKRSLMNSKISSLNEDVEDESKDNNNKNNNNNNNSEVEESKNDDESKGELSIIKEEGEEGDEEEAPIDPAAAFEYDNLADDLKQAFQPIQVRNLELNFKKFDADMSGAIDGEELKLLINTLGQQVTEEEIEILIKSVDENNNGIVEFNEFVRLVFNMKTGMGPEGGQKAGFRRIYIAMSAGNEVTRRMTERLVEAGVKARAAGKLIEMRRVFCETDADGSGGIDEDELHFAMKALKLRTTRSMCLKIIDKFDIDGSGVIEEWEYMQFMRESGSHLDQKMPWWRRMMMKMFTPKIVPRLKPSMLARLRLQYAQECRRIGAGLPQDQNIALRMVWKPTDKKLALGSLDLRNASVGDDHIIALSRALKAVPVISELLLNGNFITDKGAEMLEECIKWQSENCLVERIVSDEEDVRNGYIEDGWTTCVECQNLIFFDSPYSDAINERTCTQCGSPIVRPVYLLHNVVIQDPIHVDRTVVLAKEKARAFIIEQTKKTLQEWHDHPRDEKLSARDISPDDIQEAVQILRDREEAMHLSMNDDGDMRPLSGGSVFNDGSRPSTALSARFNNRQRSSIDGNEIDETKINDNEQINNNEESNNNDSDITEDSDDDEEKDKPPPIRPALKPSKHTRRASVAEILTRQTNLFTQDEFRKKYLSWLKKQEDELKNDIADSWGIDKKKEEKAIPYYQDLEQFCENLYQTAQIKEYHTMSQIILEKECIRLRWEMYLDMNRWFRSTSPLPTAETELANRLRECLWRVICTFRDAVSDWTADSTKLAKCIDLLESRAIELMDFYRGLNGRLWMTSIASGSTHNTVVTKVGMIWMYGPGADGRTGLGSEAISYIPSCCHVFSLPPKNTIIPPRCLMKATCANAIHNCEAKDGFICKVQEDAYLAFDNVNPAFHDYELARLRFANPYNKTGIVELRLDAIEGPLLLKFNIAPIVDGAGEISISMDQSANYLNPNNEDRNPDEGPYEFHTQSTHLEDRLPNPPYRRSLYMRFSCENLCVIDWCEFMSCWAPAEDL